MIYSETSSAEAQNRSGADLCDLGFDPGPLEFHPLGLIGKAQCFRQFGQVAVEDLLQAVQSQLDPVVRYPALRKIVGPDLCAAIARAHLRPAVLGGLLLLFPDRPVQEAGAEDLEGFGLVLVL